MVVYRLAQPEQPRRRNLSRVLLRGLAGKGRRARQRSILLRRDCTLKTRKIKKSSNEMVLLKKENNVRGPASMHDLFC